MNPPQVVLDYFNADLPTFAAQSDIATVWKVRYKCKSAALKIYKDGNTHDEWVGFDLLAALNGCGTAQFFGRTDGAALLEWLDGPSLGDLSRAGQDRQATTEIGRIAGLIHDASTTLRLPFLETVFEALLACEISLQWAQSTQQDIGRAISIARAMLASQIEICALHGDLHHDNIRMGERGYTAFDCKGIIGDRAYDVANVFKNPENAQHVFVDPTMITQRATDLAHMLDLTPKRILGWATAHCALSIVWTGDFASNAALTLLPKLTSAYQAQPR